jgi:hypothetical protein
MLIVLCYLAVAVALLSDVNGTTSIRSHYRYNGSRIKGERTSDRRQLQIEEPKKTKKHGENILFTLHQVVSLFLRGFNNSFPVPSLVSHICMLNVRWVLLPRNPFGLAMTTVDRCLFSRNESKN